MLPDGSPHALRASILSFLFWHNKREDVRMTANTECQILVAVGSYPEAGGVIDGYI